MTPDDRTTEIVTPATAGALTTLAVLKDQVAVTDTASDGFLTRQIVTASSWIAAACGGRTFGRETVRDTFRLPVAPVWTSLNLPYGPGQTRRIRPLFLSRDLLEDGAVASVTVNGVLLDPSLYSVDIGAGLVWRLSASGAKVAWSAWPVAVEFTSGWVLPGQTGRTLPPVVEDVCLDRAASAFYARGRDPNVQRERIEGGDLQYFAAAADGSATDRRLDPYKVRA